MGKVFDVSILTNRAVVETAVLVVLALTAALVLHNLHHVSAANTGSTNLSATPGPSPFVNNQSSVPAEGSSGSAQNTNQTRVTVNGQVIDVPQNGSFNRTITDGSTTTTVNAQSSNSSSTSQGGVSNSNNSSVNVNVNSHTEGDSL
jgi:hypothetical protein